MVDGFPLSPARTAASRLIVAWTARLVTTRTGWCWDAWTTFFCAMIGFYQTWTKSLSFSTVENETWAIVSDNRLRALLLHHILSHLQLIARTNQTNLPTGFVVLWPANFEVSGTALFQLRFFQDQMLKNVCASQLRAAVEIAGAWKIGRNCWKQMLRTRNQLKNCQSSTAFLGPSISPNRSRQSL